MLERIKEINDHDFNDIRRAINDVYKVNESLKILDESFHLYGFPVKIRDMLENAKKIMNFSPLSQEVLISEMNLMIHDINIGIDNYNEPDVDVVLSVGIDAGKKHSLKKSVADSLVKKGIAVYKSEKE